MGSRFTAAVIDFTIQSTIVLAAALALLGVQAFTTGEAISGPGAAIFAVVLFLVIFGYDILFEVLNGGRTPGKLATGLRVVRIGGQPVGFLTSAIRNLLRLVDILPFPPTYLVGCVSILASRHNQRLGDIAAGTLVIRERGPRSREIVAVPRVEPTVADRLAVWDVSAVTAEELAAVRSFLARRSELTYDARLQVARTLAEALRSKVAGAPEIKGDEGFLEQLAAAKAGRS